LQPTGPALDVTLGHIVSIVIDSRRDGSWTRLKACRHCQWVVFDPSKNRSSRWCSMNACGGRHNAREYRRRQRSAG
jgi:predicted RNA-binding Zn ribbon-like protein